MINIKGGYREEKQVEYLYVPTFVKVGDFLAFLEASYCWFPSSCPREQTCTCSDQAKTRKLLWVCVHAFGEFYLEARTWKWTV